LRGSPSASSSAAEVSLTSSGLGLFPFGMTPEVRLDAGCLAAEVRLNAVSPEACLSAGVGL
jgi:hypothetical protein